jgi:L-ribulose-5-phosphate 3-epimerase
MHSLDTITLGIYEKGLPAAASWSQRLDMAAQAGFGFVEVSIDESEERLQRLDWTPAQRAEVRQAVAESGVMVTSMCLSAHRKYPMGSASPEIRQRGLDIMRRSVDLAQDIGARILLVPGYDTFYEPGSQTTQAYFMEGLHRAVEWGGSAAVMLALENTEHFVTSITQAMGYVRALNSPWFQLYADVGNLYALGFDAVTELEAGSGHIAGVHIKDVLPGEFRYIPFGEGMVPFEKVFRKLWESGFHGPIMLEMWANTGDNALQAVSDARRWVWARIEQSLRDLPAQLPVGQREDIKS